MNTLKRIFELAKENPNDQDLGAEVRKLVNRKFELSDVDSDSCVGCAFENDGSMCMTFYRDQCCFYGIYKEVKG